MVRLNYLSALSLAFLFTTAGLAPPAQNDAKAKPKELAKAKVESARQACQLIAQEYLEGKATVEQVNTWSRRWLGAQRDILGKRSEMLTALEAHIGRLQELEKAARTRYEQKKGQASDIF